MKTSRLSIWLMTTVLVLSACGDLGYDAVGDRDSLGQVTSTLSAATDFDVIGADYINVVGEKTTSFSADVSCGSTPVNSSTHVVYDTECANPLFWYASSRMNKQSLTDCVAKYANFGTVVVVGSYTRNNDPIDPQPTRYEITNVSSSFDQAERKVNATVTYDSSEIVLRGSDIYAVLVNYDVQAGALPRNIALNQPVTASSIEAASLSPERAVDGDLSTRWSSAFVDDAWIAVDLGQPSEITRVVLDWETAYSAVFAIETSNDGQEWFEIYRMGGHSGERFDRDFSGVTARYVRMHGLQRATPWGHSLYEFEVWGAPQQNCGTGFSGNYKILAAHSGKALDVSEISHANGARVHQWQYVDGANQQWNISELGSGEYRLTARHSGRALDADASGGGGMSDGTHVIQWDWHGGANQRWRLEPLGNDVYRIINVRNGLALDVDSLSSANGAKIHLWSYWGGPNQHWVIQKLPN